MTLIAFQFTFLHIELLYICVSTSTPTITKDDKRLPQWDYFRRMGNSFLGINSNLQPIPESIKTNSWRLATNPDFAPYFEVKRTLIDLERELRELVYNKFKNNEEIKKGELSEIYEPLKQIIPQFLPHLRFKEIVLDDKNNYSINFINQQEQTIEYDSLSSGEKEIISFFFPIIYFKMLKKISLLKKEAIPSFDLVFLIDTPEEHLHTNLQLSFIRYIKTLLTSSNTLDIKLQFITCTHSHIIINESPQELFIMNFPKTSIDNQLIDSKHVRKNDELDLLLGNLGLVAISSEKPIILVEGPIYVDILSIFFESVNMKSSLLPMYGKGQIYNIIESLKRIILELDKQKVKLFAIVDKDRHALFK